MFLTLQNFIDRRHFFLKMHRVATPILSPTAHFHHLPVSGRPVSSNETD
jgi:hypothetical protein